MKKWMMILAVVVGLTVIGDVALAQCPMCKTSLEANRKNDKNRVGNGINNGILYLLAMPFIAVGSVGAIYVYRQRKG
ncbi:MAG: hypothetical protein Q8J69_00815 [Sphingobacteriaceae bacterium]|nr:hypothetical protein [Sphingobacteriaceae bacterium]